ncbi:3080_t:CDS:2 [Funneliformis geosporum]|uniref:6605_t:CDS:1 n=1 Tax=Funneliformis geosporum TaxID=1117311 RepID=A0A9W4SMT7_9GLOM|nr:6605_t:CDS:2 [Funneliformis geosporum]CAI2175820.1 3080_t:CDS:2 [Funneliformis geosporum]
MEDLFSFNNDDYVKERLNELINQVSKLYSSKNIIAHYLDHFKRKAILTKLDDNAPESVKRVEKACNDFGIHNVSRFYHVESDYYNWELQRRAFRLIAPSINHLCKSVIFENTRCSHDSIDDPLNSRYYCVITQYVGSINTQKLLNFVRTLRHKQLSKKNYNFRVADEEKSIQLTGFESNGVSPIGMTFRIPIILTNAITELQPPVFYLGAGHIDWKLALPINSFIHATNCFIADLS